MENTPLCYIVPNCNIDQRQTDGNTDPHTNGAQFAHIYKYVDFRTGRPTPPPNAIHTANNFFKTISKKLKKLY